MVHIIELLLFFLCIFLPILILIIWGNRKSVNIIKKEHMEDFKSFLSGLGLEYEEFHGRIYGYGRYKNHYISFKHLHDSKVSLSESIQDFYGSVVLCRVKIPDTKGLRLHLVVLTGRYSNIRNSFGWINPELGFFIARSRGQSRRDTLNIFNKLSSGTKERMVEVADKYHGSCIVSADWETVMIGRNNALKLVSGNENALYMLDFQVRIPSSISCGSLIDYLDLAVDTVERLSRELKEIS